MDSMKLKDTCGEKLGPQLAQEHRPPNPTAAGTTAWGQPGAQSGSQWKLQTQDWVCVPPQRSRRRSRHWSLSIEERRRLAMQSCWERRGAAGPSAPGLDIAQTVALMVSEDVDKDLLIPHPPRSIESTHAFHAFLARSSPFWQNVNVEAQASGRSPS